MGRGGRAGRSEGRPEPAGFIAAHTMFKLEVGRGNALAMKEMGLLFLRGQSVVQDSTQSYMGLTPAKRFAPDEAFWRDAVENQFTTEVNGNLKNQDRSAVHRLGNVWMALHLLQ